MTSKKKRTAKFQKPGKKPTSVAMKTPKANDTSKKPRIGILIADELGAERQARERRARQRGREIHRRAERGRLVRIGDVVDHVEVKREAVIGVGQPW